MQENKVEDIKHRISLWDELKKKQDEELAAKGKQIFLLFCLFPTYSDILIVAKAKSIKISLPDGKSLDGIAYKTTPLDVAGGISQGLQVNAVVAKVDGILWDVHRPLESDCCLALISFGDAEAKKVFLAF